jgi:hypothetical protein
MRSLLVLLLIGCNGGGVGIGAGDVPTYSDYEMQAVKAACRFFTNCGEFSKSQESACESFYGATLADQAKTYSISDAISAGRISYDANAAAACLNAYNSADCDFTSLLQAISTCQKIFTGKVQTGGACHIDVECANGFCSGPQAGCAGTCTAFPAIGDACAGGRCGPDGTCDSMSQKCVALGGKGATCDLLSAPCQTGLDCVTVGSSSTCQPPGAEGQPCGFSFSTPACQSGLYCDGDTQTCLRPVESGGACNSNSSCDGGLVCVIAGNATSGTCQPIHDIGQHCEPGDHSGCASDATCDASTSTCELAGQAGDDCSSTSCAPQFYCDATTMKCAAKVASGGACDPQNFDACITGSCDSTTKTCGLVCM